MKLQYLILLLFKIFVTQLLHIQTQWKLPVVSGKPSDINRALFVYIPNISALQFGQFILSHLNMNGFESLIGCQLFLTKFGLKPYHTPLYLMKQEG
jgi:hypothetical protein